MSIYKKRIDLYSLLESYILSLNPCETENKGHKIAL